MTTVICRSCGEVHEGPFKLTPSELTCPCGGHRCLPSELKPRKPLRRVSEKREGAARRRGSTLKRGRGFAASKEQREKVRGLPCVACGKEPDWDGAVIDPAHVWPRGKGGCDHPDCVVPLCREDHYLFDIGDLELLPSLIDRGYWAEMAHPISAHQVSPTLLVQRLTGDPTVRGEAG